VIYKILLLAGIAAACWIAWRRSRMARPSMPPREARALLGVSDEAGVDEIRAAHRRLMIKVHPDAGGSAELAGRVNAARDVLVAHLNRNPTRAS
jgi:DnaJ family protein C protein 19